MVTAGPANPNHPGSCVSMQDSTVGGKGVCPGSWGGSPRGDSPGRGGPRPLLPCRATSSQKQHARHRPCPGWYSQLWLLRQSVTNWGTNQKSLLSPSGGQKAKIEELLQGPRGRHSLVSSSFLQLHTPWASVHVSPTSPPLLLSSHGRLPVPASPPLTPKNACHWIWGSVGPPSVVLSQGPSPLFQIWSQ